MILFYVIVHGLPPLQNVVALLLGWSTNGSIKTHHSAQATNQHHVMDHSWMDRYVAFPIVNHKYPEPEIQTDNKYSPQSIRYIILIYSLSTGEIASLPQLQFRSFICEGGRKDFTRFDINADTVYDWPISLTAQNCVQFANASLGKIYF